MIRSFYFVDNTLQITAIKMVFSITLRNKIWEISAALNLDNIDSERFNEDDLIVTENNKTGRTLALDAT